MLKKTLLILIICMLLFTSLVFALEDEGTYFPFDINDWYKVDAVSKIGYLSYKGYTSQGYKYEWVDNPSYKPSTSQYPPVFSLYSKASDVWYMSEIEVYDERSETYLIDETNLSGEAPNSWVLDKGYNSQGRFDIHLDPKYINVTKINRKLTFYATHPIDKYLVGRGSYNITYELKWNVVYPTGSELPRPRIITISPSGYFGTTEKDIQITLSNVPKAFIYLENGNGERTLIDEVDNMGNLTILNYLGAEIPYHKATTGDNKFVVQYFPNGYNPSIPNSMQQSATYEKVFRWNLFDPDNPDGGNPDEEEILNPDDPFKNFIGIVSHHTGEVVPNPTTRLEVVYRFKGSESDLKFTSSIPNSTIGQPYDVVINPDNTDWLIGKVDILVPLKRGMNAVKIELREKVTSNISIFRDDVSIVLNYNGVGGIVGGGVYDDFVSEESGNIDADLTLNGALKTFLAFMADMKDFFSSFTVIFSWLPPQIYALIILALTLGLVFRVVGR